MVIESPDTMEGKQDTCPVCGHVHIVPPPAILHQCPRCKAVLESPGKLGGKIDVCPACGSHCPVPPSMKQQADEEFRKRKQIAAARANMSAEEQAELARQLKAEQAAAAFLITQTPVAQPDWGATPGANPAQSRPR
jgi:DNA-directed RNA polymerase subunit M/transcription elongation factor TFIIS